MITIAEPKELIDKLWGKQKIREDDTYRLMRYVLRVDHEDKVLLHNVVTGRLVVLEREEAEALETLPSPYSPVMEQLVTEHYLVPENYDEHQQVVNLRRILQTLEDAQPKKGIIHYTILPTTACNAHCYYCYQHGLKSETMTAQTASDVAMFIKKNCQGNKVWIRWFGGEPTLAVHLIDQICEGLRANSIDFASRMTTNGYLIDKELIEKMKVAWHLEQVMISSDGSETNYNETKAFTGVHDNPYQRVLRNIGLLLDQGVGVSLRMNFDDKNYEDFSNLLEDAEREFGNNPLLQVRPHHIIRKKNTDTNDSRDYEQWCNEKIVDLNELSRRKGMLHKEYPLPCLEYRSCLAASDEAVVIMPDGSLVSCPDLLGNDQVKGNIWQGIVDKEKALSWKQFGDYKRCRDCLFFPKCAVALNCEGGGSCIHLNEYIKQYSNTAALLHSVS